MCLSERAGVVCVCVPCPRPSPAICPPDTRRRGALPTPTPPPPHPHTPPRHPHLSYVSIRRLREAGSKAARWCAAALAPTLC